MTKAIDFSLRLCTHVSDPTPSVISRPISIQRCFPRFPSSSIRFYNEVNANFQPNVISLLPDWKNRGRKLFVGWPRSHSNACKHSSLLYKSKWAKKIAFAKLTSFAYMCIVQNFNLWPCEVRYDYITLEYKYNVLTHISPASCGFSEVIHWRVTLLL